MAALRGPDRIVTSVVEVPDGVMASYYKGAVLRWNLTSRASDEPLQAGDNVDVTTIAVTPNGRYLVTGGSDIKFLAIIPLTNPY